MLKTKNITQYKNFIFVINMYDTLYQNNIINCNIKLHIKHPY